MAQSTDRMIDEYLVLASRAGDREAFEALARRWQKKLIAHAWRLTGDTETAKDAVQAGWIEIVRGLHRLQDEKAFPAWAYRIISRRCAKHIGRTIKQREMSAELARQPEVEIDNGTARVDAERLRMAIRILPPEQRSAIALFHFEEMSVAEVAVALNVPAGTVKTRLMHARRKLRAVLEGEE